jgi:hypothetical protein
MSHADDPYRRNPARDIEALAAATVAGWVGDRGTVLDTGRGHGPDFRIDYNDGRIGLGEVGWHVDQVVQEMWANAFRQESHQTVPLRPGSGQWSTKLIAGANIRGLYRGLQGVIDLMAAAGKTRLSIAGSWPRSEVADAARLLGLEYLAFFGYDEPASATFFMPSPPDMSIPSDPDSITHWVDEVLSHPDYADTTSKLLKLQASERHVFLMTGSRTDFGIEERLRRVNDAVPVRAPQVPVGITHVWLVAQFGAGPAALWSNAGWLTVPVQAG